MERHGSFRGTERATSITSLRSLERGDRTTTLKHAERAPSLRSATERLGSLSTRDQHSFWVRLSTCLCYAFMSVSITLFNKAVFSIFNFPFPSFVTTLQIVVSIFYMLVLHRFRMMDLGTTWNLQTAKQVFPLAFFWWLYVVSGVTALRFLNVPMYSVLRRSTTLIVVAGEWIVFNKRPSLLSGGSILVMIVGAVIAGATDLSYSLPGYIYVSVCAVSTAVYLILIRLISDKTGLSPSGLQFYNNCIALPMMFSYMVLATNELREMAVLPQIRDPHFLGVLLFSASQAYFLNVCIFYCTTYNSALTTTVTGQMKDVVTTGLGMIMFGDVLITAKNVTGVCIGLLGGMLYSMLSYFERNNARKS